MHNQCEYCGAEYDEKDTQCPQCGAPITSKTQSNIQKPTTISELKQWYIDRKLPSEDVTRFYIGKDYKGKRAFGIYQDEQTGKFVVYKNKDTGERAIRYEGYDEATAVNELYLRLKQEIRNQKNHAFENVNSKKSVSNMFVWLFAAIAVISALGIFGSIKIPDQGYYHYNSIDYYYLAEWYYYNIYDNSWYVAENVDETLVDNYQEYYTSRYYFEGVEYTDFSYTTYYEQWEDSQSDSDYDWDSGSDSWDSSGTDWSSDW